MTVTVADMMKLALDLGRDLPDLGASREVIEWVQDAIYAVVCPAAAKRRADCARWQRDKRERDAAKRTAESPSGDVSLTRDEPSPPAPPLKKKNTETKGSAFSAPLPDDFEVSEEVVAAAVEDGLPADEVAAALEDFHDHYTCLKGRDVVATDWNEVFRAYCRKRVRMLERGVIPFARRKGTPRRRPVAKAQPRPTAPQKTVSGGAVFVEIGSPEWDALVKRNNGKPLFAKEHEGKTGRLVKAEELQAALQAVAQAA